MYNELLSEADSNRALEKNIAGLQENVKKGSKKVKEKQEYLMKTKRRFENLEHVRILNNKKHSKWLYF